MDDADAIPIGDRLGSLTTLVRDEIERMILDGEIAAGERLNENALAASLNVSRGPVREATWSLEQAGLVKIVRNRGVFVRKISLEDALHLYDVRSGLARIAGRLAASRVTEEQIAGLQAVYDNLEKAREITDQRAYHEGNRQFHAKIVEIAANPRLSSYHETIEKELRLFVRQSVRGPERLQYQVANIDRSSSTSPGETKKVRGGLRAPHSQRQTARPEELDSRGKLTAHLFPPLERANAVGANGPDQTALADQEVQMGQAFANGEEDLMVIQRLLEQDLENLKGRARHGTGFQGAVQPRLMMRGKRLHPFVQADEGTPVPGKTRVSWGRRWNFSRLARKRRSGSASGSDGHTLTLERSGATPDRRQSAHPVPRNKGWRAHSCDRRR